MVWGWKPSKPPCFMPGAFLRRRPVLSAFLEGHLTTLTNAAVALATGRFDCPGAVPLSQVVSQAVHDGLALAKGTEVVQLVDGVWDT